MELEVLRRFYKHIHEVIAHPRDVTLLLFQEGVVSKETLGEVIVETKPISEKNVSIMRAVSSAVKGDPKKLLMLIAVLDRFAESAPVASRMRDGLRSQWLQCTTAVEKIFLLVDLQCVYFTASHQTLGVPAEGSSRLLLQGMLEVC